MRLRATTEHDTYVYATSPINFGGIYKEDLIIWLFPMAAVKSLTEEALLGFVAGSVCLWLFKKVTRRQPAGFLVLKASVWLGRVTSSMMLGDNKSLASAGRGLAKVLGSVWFEAGLLPAPTQCNKYEP